MQRQITREVYWKVETGLAKQYTGHKNVSHELKLKKPFHQIIQFPGTVFEQKTTVHFVLKCTERAYS